MLPTDDVFLAVTREALVAGVAPFLQGEPRKLLDSGVRLALEELIYRHSEGIGRQRAIRDALTELAATHAALAAECPDAGLTAVDASGAGSDPEDFAALTVQIDALRAALVAQAPRIAARLSAADVGPQWRVRARAYLTALTRNELDEATRDFPPSRADAGVDRIEVRKDLLKETLRTRLAAPDLEILDHRRISGGFSRDTFTVNTRADGREARYVIRAAVEGPGFLEDVYRTLAQEYPLLKLARAHGVPAPPVRFLEEDSAVIGSPFILMDHCSGSAVGDTMQAHQDVDAGFFRNLAKLLANLHKLPWEDHVDCFPALDGRAKLSVFECTQSLLAKKRRWRASVNLRPSAALTLADDWLTRHVPPNDRQASFIHFDIGFHNMLIDREEICALLDWEGGDLGSPAWDLVAARLMLDDRVTWAQFAGWYVEAGGVLPSEEEMAYYLMARAYVGNVACSVALEKMLGASGRAAYLELGLAARPFYLSYLLETAEGLWTARP